MGKNINKSNTLDLSAEVPEKLSDLYIDLRVANGEAIMSVKRGETNLQREWRLASRLCRQFLFSTEEPAQLALTSGLGDWDAARVADEPPDDEYTYQLWLAAQAWRLLEFCRQVKRRKLIEPVRHCAREGITAVKTASVLTRTVAYQALRAEHKIEDRVRGPKMQPAGVAASVRSERDS